MTDNKVEVTVTAADVRLLLRAVLPHAGRSSGHPRLNSVRLEYEPGALWAAATDRYTIAAQRILVAASSTPYAVAAVTIGRGDARRILRHIGPAGLDPIPLTIAADGLTLARAGSRLHVPSVDGDYPDWRKLIGRYLHRDGSAAVPALRVNLEMLGRHKQAWKLHRKRNLNTDAASVLMMPGRQDEPLVVAIGEHYVGLQMPRRPAAQHTLPPPLLAAFPPPDGHSVGKERL